MWYLRIKLGLKLGDSYGKDVNFVASGCANRPFDYLKDMRRYLNLKEEKSGKYERFA